MILCLFFFSSLKHSVHQWTPDFVPFFSSPHLMFFFLTVWQRCYFSHAYLAVSTVTAWFFSNHIFSLLLLTSLQPFSAVPPTSPSTSASLFSLPVVTFHPPMLLYTVHINECERSPCCSESYWEDVCMCVWLRMHVYRSTRAQIRVYGEGFSMTHWLTSPEAQWGCVYWWRNPVNEERRMRASTRHSNLYLKL